MTICNCARHLDDGLIDQCEAPDCDAKMCAACQTEIDGRLRCLFCAAAERQIDDDDSPCAAAIVGCALVLLPAFLMKVLA